MLKKHKAWFNYGTVYKYRFSAPQLYQSTIANQYVYGFLRQDTEAGLLDFSEVCLKIIKKQVCTIFVLRKLRRFAEFI